MMAMTFEENWQVLTTRWFLAAADIDAFATNKRVVSLLQRLQIGLKITSRDNGIVPLLFVR
jgi:hypothetical protein